MKPLVYLRNDPHDRLDLIEEAARSAGMSLRDHDALGGAADWPPAHEVAGVIAGGGAMNADQVERYPFLLRERRLLREAVEEGVPVLAICLGAQLLARGLDAPVMRAGQRELGFSVLELTPEGEADPVLSALATGDRVFHFHEDTFVLPEGAVLLARDPVVEAQAYRVGDRAWAVQFHPEIERSTIEAWIEEVGERLEPEWGKAPEAVLAEADEHLDGHRERSLELFARFAAFAGAPA